MYEKLEECPACNHTQFNNFMICNDHSISQESFALVKCSKCQLVFTNPRPTAITIANYYKSDNYISHSNTANNLINTLYKFVRRFTLRQKSRLIEKHRPKGNLLDFGCGTGNFIHHMQNRHWNVTGIEPDAKANDTATQLLNKTILSSLRQLNQSEKFDVITAWHVLEHVHDLKETLRTLRKKLKPDGYLFIALPNHNSYDAMIYREHWAAYDVPRHLYHFSIDSFQRLAKSQKLNLIDTLPMKFDSYYVSMLSEKYKTGHSNYLTALINGRKSNLQAKLKKGEYSSIIYVLST